MDYKFYSPITSLPFQFKANEKFKILITPFAKYMFQYYYMEEKQLQSYKEIAEGVYFSKDVPEVKYEDKDIEYSETPIQTLLEQSTNEKNGSEQQETHKENQDISKGKETMNCANGV